MAPLIRLPCTSLFASCARRGPSIDLTLHQSTQAMSYRTAGHPSHLRNQSLSASASTQSTALQQRINEKRVELENLKQLRDLSAGLAGQMEQLEEKLATLSGGTEGECSLSNVYHRYGQVLILLKLSRLCFQTGTTFSVRSIWPRPRFQYRKTLRLRPSPICRRLLCASRYNKPSKPKPSLKRRENEVDAQSLTYIVQSGFGSKSPQSKIRLRQG